jgi:hypothetical protein
VAREVPALSLASNAPRRPKVTEGESGGGGGI